MKPRIAMHRESLRAVDLRVGWLYFTPSGRLCRLAPKPEPGKGDAYWFEYLDGEPRPAQDGFSLSAANVGLLRPAVGYP